MEWRFNNDMPIYSQLVNRIKQAIAAGELLPGDKMATVRDMAMEAGVNPNTMQRALQELERQGLVYTQRSSGRFVTEDTGCINRAKAALARRHVDEFKDAMAKLGYSGEEIIALLKGSMEEEQNGNML